LLQSAAFKDNYIWCLRRGAMPQSWIRGRRSVLITCEPRVCNLRDLNTITTQIMSAATRPVVEYNVPVFGPAHEDIPALRESWRKATNRSAGNRRAAARFLTSRAIPRAHRFLRDGVVCRDTLSHAAAGRLFEGTPAKCTRR